MSLLSNIWKHLLFFLDLLEQNSSLTKTTDTCSFLLKTYLIVVDPTTLLYLSTIPSCMSAVGEETIEPETSYCLRWKLFCYSSPSHLTLETFISPSALCLSFVLFVFVFQPIETTTADLQGFTIEFKYRGNLECWMRICAVQNIETKF